MQEIVETGTGTSLAVEAAGQGETLLLIQGMSGHGAMWGAALVDELARDFEVVTYDHRGIGESARADDPFSIADLAADAAGLLTALGHESAHVMGISMGGMVAQELTLRAPERVRSVTFGCTTPGGPGAFDAPGPGRMVEAIGTRDAEHATRVGFEVRLEVTPDDVLHPEPVQVALTRTEARALDLHPGDRVWLRPAVGAQAVGG